MNSREIIQRKDVEAPLVQLPGVPERRLGRWQPLFRDPSFGNSIKPQALLKQEPRELYRSNLS